MHLPKFTSESTGGFSSKHCRVAGAERNREQDRSSAPAPRDGWMDGWMLKPSLNPHKTTRKGRARSRAQPFLGQQVTGKGVQLHHVAFYQTTTPQPQREVYRNRWKLGNSQVRLPGTAPSPQGTRSHCQGTLSSAMWHLNQAGRWGFTQSAAKTTGVKNKGSMITEGNE